MRHRASTLRPDEVFTPRAAKVNPAMYVERQDLETSLKLALQSGLHIVIHGESGCGKSWLYKKVLEDQHAYQVIGNLANASRLGSIAAELENLVSREGGPEKRGYTETKEAGANLVVAAKLSHEADFVVGQKEPFEKLLTRIRKDAGSAAPGILVLDNLENIYQQPALLQELGDLLILLDDERYAKYRVRIIIVGVPGDLRQYYTHTPNLATVANRLREVKEVSRLDRKQCDYLVDRGFQLLGFNVTYEDRRWILEHIAWVTDRVPQRIHEYCLELATIADEKKAPLSVALVPECDQRWLNSSLYSAYTTVEQAMNERETRIGRRNQVLFALGLVDKEEFRVADIEDLIRKEFLASTKDKTLNIGGLLSELAKLTNPLIRRSPKGDAYIFRDPMYRMALRTMLEKDKEGDKVAKKPLAR